jgi:hypothetical protein
MSFSIPQITFVDPTEDRAIPQTPPLPAQIQRLIDVERSFSTYGRQIYGWGRGSDAFASSMNEPTRPFQIQRTAGFKPLHFFAFKVPILGAGPSNPYGSVGNYNQIAHFHCENNNLRVHFELSELDGTPLDVLSPTPEWDSANLVQRYTLNWGASDLVPGEFRLLRILVGNNVTDNSGTDKLWAGCLHWQDINDIEPTGA